MVIRECFSYQGVRDVLGSLLQQDLHAKRVNSLCGFYEHRVLVGRLAELLPAGVKVCIVADRDFGDQKPYKMLTEEPYFDYVIRFRGTAAD